MTLKGQGECVILILGGLSKRMIKLLKASHQIVTQNVYEQANQFLIEGPTHLQVTLTQKHNMSLT